VSGYPPLGFYPIGRQRTSTDYRLFVDLLSEGPRSRLGRNDTGQLPPCRLLEPDLFRMHERRHRYISTGTMRIEMGVKEIGWRIAFVLLVAPLIFSAQAPPIQKVILRGTVARTLTSAPIAGAELTLFLSA